MRGGMRPCLDFVFCVAHDTVRRNGHFLSMRGHFLSMTHSHAMQHTACACLNALQEREIRSSGNVTRHEGGAMPTSS